MTRSLASFPALALLAVLSVVCGKKGPPLPPLVRVPSAPVDVKAERRGQAVDVQFAVPAANTDGSRPANLQRIEIYALNGPQMASEAEVLKAGTRVGAVDVKAPRDPNDTVDPDEPDSDVQELEGPGLDQGATARVRDLLSEAAVDGRATTRTYVSVGITTRGRRGPVSKPTAVPLGDPPGAPPQPSISYDETSITVTWAPLAAPPPAEGAEPVSVAYHVYDASPVPSGSAASGPVGGQATASSRANERPGARSADGQPRRLTDGPLEQPTYTDNRIEWHAERCYVVRGVRKYGELAVEGDASPARCTTLEDTFAPAAPIGVTAVASEGSVNLIWTPNSERDLAGYRVLRATLPSTELTLVTPTLITESSFTDAVRAGARYAYAVQAVDTAGNASRPSDRVEETAR